MSTMNVPAARMYRVMQQLLTEYAQQRVAGSAPRRDVVQEQDALDAVLNLAAVLDRNRQDGTLPPNDAQHMAALLMLVRDYIRPLPAAPAGGSGTDAGTGTEDPEADAVTEDLRIFVDGLRSARARTGMRG
ncbi:hypothetical protein [Actinacidiphila acidipaludis]|uniref:Uncharacterized protein n=1 Tax=Actinacidiphila acidipaludis TaxID=2873382 RepID=A0ABS7QCL4_9ACTN|nr:hypothetical protein [Streptomyces acidipaludis]MBY8880896.1 hypothetical protein [Streptomyces acidipaludis]